MFNFHHKYFFKPFLKNYKVKSYLVLKPSKKSKMELNRKASITFSSQNLVVQLLLAIPSLFYG